MPYELQLMVIIWEHCRSLIGTILEKNIVAYFLLKGIVNTNADNLIRELGLQM